MQPYTFFVHQIEMITCDVLQLNQYRLNRLHLCCFLAMVAILERALMMLQNDGYNCVTRGNGENLAAASRSKALVCVGVAVVSD